MNTLSDLSLLKAAQILEFDSLSSTNDKAMELIKQDQPSEGSMIYAKDQFKGKGQYANVWSSDPGMNLTCSYILYPTFLKVERQFVLSQIISLAICKALQSWGLYARIKWPNDIYVRDEKLAGILIECGLQGDKVQHAVLGVGLNINQDSFHPDLPNPTSMKILGEKELDVKEVMLEILSLLDFRYHNLQAGGAEKIHADYEERMYRYGLPTKFEFKDRSEEFKAMIRGVDERGRIKLEREGDVEHYDMSEIKMTQ